MSRSFFASNCLATVTDSTVRFFALAGGNQVDSTSANQQVPVREAGTFSNLFLYVSANTVNATTPVTLRLSGVSSSLVASVGSTQTGVFEDTTNTASAANTDEVDISIAPPSVAGTQTITTQVLGAQFDPTTTTNTVQFLVKASVTTTFLTAENLTAYYIPVGTTFSAFSSRTNAEITAYSAFTSSNLYINIIANLRTSTATFGTLINGLSGNQTISYTSGQTGIKEDTSNSDSIALNDLFCYYQTNGAGTDSLTGTLICTQYKSTTDSFPLIYSTATSANFNTTNYYAVTGQILSGFSLTEINNQYYPRNTYTLSMLEARVQTNTITISATTIKLRKNSADGNQNLSIGAGATGTFTDSSNIDSIEAGTGNEINYVMTTPNTSGSISMRRTSMFASQHSESVKSRHVFHR